jgi:hypothetical protein
MCMMIIYTYKCVQLSLVLSETSLDELSKSCVIWLSGHSQVSTSFNSNDLDDLGVPHFRKNLYIYKYGETMGVSYDFII